MAQARCSTLQPRLDRAFKIALAALALTVAASTARAVDFQWALVDDSLNPADTRPMDDCCGPVSEGTSGYGSVSYIYQIGVHEVTQGQYTEFLNAVAKTDPNAVWTTFLEPAPVNPPKAAEIARSGTPGNYVYTVAPDFANRAIVSINFYSALRFANWLHNGQPIGAQDATTTEDGAYTLLGSNPVDVQRNPGAKYFLTSEDEWYKAAYYDPESEGYVTYATGSDITPTCEPPPGTMDSANCGAVGGNKHKLFDVGAYTDAMSLYGTFDQSGSAFEWNEAQIEVGGLPKRIVRGGNWITADRLGALSRAHKGPTASFDNVGFRVATLPEAGAMWMRGAALLSLLLLYRGRRGDAKPPR